jgi:TM2 domain-containing membrane protein YozV
METFELDVLRTLNNEQRAYFQAEYNNVRKSTTTCFILALFLGGIGAHHFYMGKILLGFLYAVFVWTLVPSVIALFELFFITDRVNRWNENKAREIAEQVKFLHESVPVTA